jgi:cold shock CspA family protein
MSLTKEKELGTIKWFDQEKGFGVIEGKLGEECFLHKNSVKDSLSFYQEGSIVVFEPYMVHKKNRIGARDAYLFSKPDHWKTLQSIIKSHYLNEQSRDSKIITFPTIVQSAAIQFVGLGSSTSFIHCLKETFLELKTCVKFEWSILFCEDIILKCFSSSKAIAFLNEMTNLYIQHMEIDILFDSWEEKKLNNFWEGHQRKELVKAFLDSIDSTVNEEDKFDLFVKGFFPNASISTLERKFFTLSTNQIEEIIRSKYLSNEIALNFFPRVINQRPELGDFIVGQAKLNFSVSIYLEFEELLAEQLYESIFLKLWLNDKVSSFKPKHLRFGLQDNKTCYDKIGQLAKDNHISLIDVKNTLLENINAHFAPINRTQFKTLEFSIESLLCIDPDFKNSLEIPSYENINLILWASFSNGEFEFESIRKKFIYFDPIKQVEILKKLFRMKEIGEFDLTTQKLVSLTKFDLDLFLSSTQEIPRIPIDISTDLIIQLLDSIEKKGEFLFESDLMTIILNDLLSDQTKKFKFDHFFERCKGRTEVDYERHINGSVKKKPYKDKFYFEIFIEPEINHWKYNPDKNPDFQKITSEIKSIPGSKFNYSENYWGVPGNQEAVVWKLAVNHKFRITNSDGELGSNKHLASKILTSVPNGITFCEGRLSNKKDNTLNEKFWWCNGMPCLSHCETIHSADDWKNYTLLDFLRILNINTDEITTKGEMIPHGKFYRLISTINRFNELLKKLYCKECDHILHPLETSNFGARNVTRFHCVNDKCKNEEVVYLNHCLNGKCNNIVDSRESKTCPNGLYVCDKCGCCCSHNQVERKVKNLKMNGASISSSLSNSLNKQLGHLERGIFFCYKCGGNMEKEGSNKNILKCSDCKIEYNLKPYHFKFPHIDLPKESTDFAASKKPPANLEKDLPF